MISSEKVSAIRFDSLKAEKVAADWENGPWKSTKPFKGVTNPAGAIIVSRQLCHETGEVVKVSARNPHFFPGGDGRAETGG